MHRVVITVYVIMVLGQQGKCIIYPKYILTSAFSVRTSVSSWHTIVRRREKPVNGVFDQVQNTKSPVHLHVQRLVRVLIFRNNKCAGQPSH